MIYDFWVQEPYKTFLLRWQKTIEWRLNKWKFQKIQVWDILELETWKQFKVLEKKRL
jgi:ASC-1-like (ASCH) protein